MARVRPLKTTVCVVALMLSVAESESVVVFPLRPVKPYQTAPVEGVLLVQVIVAVLEVLLVTA